MITYNVRVYKNKDVFWYYNGKRHREDGPAVELSNGTSEWYKHGERHRENGPAIVRNDGYKSWWLNGKLHRENGPAITWPDGEKYWYLHDVLLSANEYHMLNGPKKEMTLIEVELELGYPIKIKE